MGLNHIVHMAERERPVARAAITFLWRCVVVGGDQPCSRNHAIADGGFALALVERNASRK
jgi:hypothetical protein